MTRPFAKLAAKLGNLNFDAASIDAALAPARAALAAPPSILFMGSFNAGKSSVINALVGAPVAPVGAVPVTALVTRVAYGPNHRIHRVMRSGAREPMTPTEFARLVDRSATGELSAAIRAGIRQVEVEYPAEVLRQVTLVDSPGLGSMDARDDETTLAHLADVDAVAWVFDAEKGAPDTDLVATIARLAPRLAVAWAVLNKADLKAPADRLRVQEVFDNAVGHHFRRMKLFSAKLALDAAAGKTIHPEDAAGVRLDLVEMVVKQLGPRTQVKAEVRDKALALACDAACRLVGGRWREIVADIAAANTFGVAWIGTPVLETFDRMVPMLLVAVGTQVVSGNEGFAGARYRLIKEVSAAAAHLFKANALPPGFGSSGGLPAIADGHAEARLRAELAELLQQELPQEHTRFDKTAAARTRVELHGHLYRAGTIEGRNLQEALARTLADAGREIMTWSTID